MTTKAQTASKINFTKRNIEALPLPVEGKRAYYWDTQVLGLSLAVTSKGNMTFYVRRTVDYKRQQVYIGKFPEISVEMARSEAMEICAQIATGGDPTRRRRNCEQN